jgi:hypothetical protein
MPLITTRAGGSASAFGGLGASSAVGLLPPSYESIATTLLSSNTSNVTFSTISGTYKHLQLRFQCRSTTSGTGQDGIRIRFNGDSGTNYSWHYLGGDGITAYTGQGQSQTYVYAGVAVNNGFSANRFGTTICDIFDYTNTNKHKTTRSLTGGDNNGNGETYVFGSNWRNTNAITDIELRVISGSNFMTNSSFALYGIKG